MAAPETLAELNNPDSALTIARAIKEKNLIYRGYYGSYLQGALYIDTPFAAPYAEQLANKPLLEQLQTLAQVLDTTGLRDQTPEAKLMNKVRWDAYRLFTPQGRRDHQLSEMCVEFGVTAPESELPPLNRSQENTLHTIMARWPHAIPLIRKHFGVDEASRRLRETHLLFNSGEVRTMLRLFREANLMTREDLETTFPDIAQSLLAEVWEYSFSRSSFTKLGTSSAFNAMRGDFEPDSNSDRISTEMYEPGHEPRPKYRNYPPDEIHGKNPVTVMQRLADVTVQLLERGGWQNPESYFSPFLHMLKLGYDSFDIDPGEYVPSVVSREKNLRKALRNVLDFSLQGKLMHVTSEGLMMSAADARFHQALAREGIPTVYPTLSADNSIQIQAGRPEHLLSELYNSRAQALREAHYELRKLFKPIDYSASDTYAAYFISNLDYSRQKNSAFDAQLTPVVEAVGLAGLPISSFTPSVLVAETVGYAEHFLRQPHFQPAGPTEQKQMVALANLLDALFASQMQHSYSQVKESLSVTARMLRTLARDKREVVAQDIVLEPGRPRVLLGENGGGKSTTMALMLQHCLAPGQVIAEGSSLPHHDAVEVMAVGDRVELEGKNRVFWGREQGKSSFMIEVEALIERIHQAGVSDTMQFVVGDEIGRRTDQLNAMALLATELIINARKKNLGLFSSHANSFNRMLGPLFRELGIEIQWGTMQNFQIADISETRKIKSKAFQKAKPFLPASIGMAWAAKRGEQYPAEAFGTEYVAKTYTELHQERLKQLGWCEVNYDKKLKLAGMAGDLLGMRYTSSGRRNAFSYLNPDSTYIQTLVNPRWQHNAQVPTWIRAIEANQDLTRPGMSGLYQSCSFAEECASYLSKPPEQRDPLKKETLTEQMKALQAELPQLLVQLEELVSVIPHYDAQPLLVMLSRLQTVSDIEHFQCKAEERDMFILEGLICIAHNKVIHNLKDTELSTKNGLDIQSVTGYQLARNKRNDPDGVVSNSIGIDTSIIFTGPQGSGKTEALFAIAECTLAHQLWGSANADHLSTGDTWDVIPAITIPEFPTNNPQRSLSSLEREAHDRLGMIAQYLEDLPPGVRPMVLVDELASSTNTGDASEATRALRDLVEARGGVLIAATHSHEAVWDMEAEGASFEAKYVGLFDSPEAYQWLDGHGESMGIEVAERLGLRPPYTDIAREIRNLLVENRKKRPRAQSIRVCADRINQFLNSHPA